MEELRSSEILDREIEAECRKKAEQILQKAEISVKSISDGVGKRLENAIEEAKSKAKKDLELYEKNENAALPLEKQRYLVSFIYNSIMEEINSYFENLSDEEQFSLLEKMMEKFSSVLENKNLKVRVIGFDEKKIASLLEKKFGKNLQSVEKADENVLEDEAVLGFKFRKGLLVNCINPEDNTAFLCRFTLDQKIREIMDSSCGELALALFGGRLPE